jgi:hypothetical protein
LGLSSKPPKDSERPRLQLVPKIADQKKVAEKRCKIATFLQLVTFTYGQSSPIQNLRRLP